MVDLAAHDVRDAGQVVGTRLAICWQSLETTTRMHSPHYELTPPGDRAASAKAIRRRIPRDSHTLWAPPPDRADPIALLMESNRGRLPSVAPIRFGRMLASPFAFLRGAAVVMAHDLASTPASGLHARLCGDAHVANFGGYATPERSLIFDINDFDETLPGPWEWDLKRLVTSVVVLGRENGIGQDATRAAALACARSYRKHIREYGPQPFLDIWYSVIDAGMTIAHFGAHPQPVADAFARAEQRTNQTTLPKLGERAGRGYRIGDDPPLITHQRDALTRRLPEVLRGYRSSLADERRVLFDRYEVADIARKVVGIGSVGLRCYAILLFGTDTSDPLFLQVKEVRESVLAPMVCPRPRQHQGKRVVVGQRLMQAASDLFLGWSQCGRTDYVVRQLRDMKTHVALEDLHGDDLAAYATLCGWVLARAHACSGDAAKIGGYLGKGKRFDRAVVAFGEAYADQTERDYAALVEAVRTGRVQAWAGA
ncbi:MAG: DUF2252 domain-containing protein [Thermomicrobiales bacterium]